MLVLKHGMQFAISSFQNLMKLKNTNMKNTLILSLMLISSLGVSQNLPSHTFLGERYHYSVKFGWFKVGKVEFSSSDRFSYENGKRYFDIDINAGTAGLGGVFTDFKGDFNTKIDVKTLLPVSSFRNMKSKESDDRRTDYYTFSTNSLHIKTVRHKNNKISERDLSYKTMYDVATAVLQLRAKDLSGKTQNQSLGQINVFWNRTVYPVSAKYSGKEEMKHNGEKISVHKVYMYLPKSGFLKDGKPVVAWISADGRNVPIKFEAKTRYGSIKCELDDDL